MTIGGIAGALRWTKLVQNLTAYYWMERLGSYARVCNLLYVFLFDFFFLEKKNHQKKKRQQPKFVLACTTQAPPPGAAKGAKTRTATKIVR